MRLCDRFLEARAVMVRLVATPTVHNYHHLAVVHNALAAIGTVAIGRLTRLVACGNVGFRLLFCHDLLRRLMNAGWRSLLNIIAYLVTSGCKEP